MKSDSKGKKNSKKSNRKNLKNRKKSKDRKTKRKTGRYTKKNQKQSGGGEIWSYISRSAANRKKKIGDGLASAKTATYKSAGKARGSFRSRGRTRRSVSIGDDTKMKFSKKNGLKITTKDEFGNRVATTYDVKGLKMYDPKMYKELQQAKRQSGDAYKKKLTELQSKMESGQIKLKIKTKAELGKRSMIMPQWSKIKSKQKFDDKGRLVTHVSKDGGIRSKTKFNYNEDGSLANSRQRVRKSWSLGRGDRFATTYGKDGRIDKVRHHKGLTGAFGTKATKYQYSDKGELLGVRQNRRRHFSVLSKTNGMTKIEHDKYKERLVKYNLGEFKPADFRDKEKMIAHFKAQGLDDRKAKILFLKFRKDSKNAQALNGQSSLVSSSLGKRKYSNDTLGKITSGNQEIKANKEQLINAEKIRLQKIEEVKQKIEQDAKKRQLNRIAAIKKAKKDKEEAALQKIKDVNAKNRKAVEEGKATRKANIEKAEREKEYNNAYIDLFN